MVRLRCGVRANRVQRGVRALPKGRGQPGQASKKDQLEELKNHPGERPHPSQDMARASSPVQTGEDREFTAARR